MKLWNFDALSGDVCCAAADLSLKEQEKLFCVQCQRYAYDEH